MKFTPVREFAEIVPNPQQRNRLLQQLDLHKLAVSDIENAGFANRNLQARVGELLAVHALRFALSEAFFLDSDFRNP